ncbi:late competence development ComFB family protein [Halodesulfovibrio aestuarii]|uniref:Late competence development ComFB family protein n=1 Tax=Halodesulfovibrio aestuarii TaxID=126333 RepID=A0A8G2C9R5_9BACT|nr:late competence development ComFB family protein [Halodesulfovibrio aestuarii]SHJ14094.1 Late competence development protein ComFB [Halodesulfovibrio aestuarii]
MDNKKYFLNEISLFNIRNRNEVRVIKIMKQVMDTPPYYKPSEKDLLDIYALSLNSLPPRYAQQGTIVLRDPVRDNEIEDAVRKAFAIVVENPKK